MHIISTLIQRQSLGQNRPQEIKNKTTKVNISESPTISTTGSIIKILALLRGAIAWNLCNHATAAFSTNATPELPNDMTIVLALAVKYFEVISECNYSPNNKNQLITTPVVNTKAIQTILDKANNNNSNNNNNNNNNRNNTNDNNNNNSNCNNDSTNSNNVEVDLLLIKKSIFILTQQQHYLILICEWLLPFMTNYSIKSECSNNYTYDIHNNIDNNKNPGNGFSNSNNISSIFAAMSLVLLDFDYQIIAKEYKGMDQDDSKNISPNQKVTISTSVKDVTIIYPDVNPFEEILNAASSFLQHRLVERPELESLLGYLFKGMLAIFPFDWIKQGKSLLTFQ